MAEIIQNNDAMRKVDEVAMVTSSALTDKSSTLTSTEVFMEPTVDKPESPRDLHLVSEHPSTQTRRAVREKPKVLPKPKLRAPQDIYPPQDNCSGDVRPPNNKPKTLPKPSLNVVKETDPQRDSSREQGGSPKEKPLVPPKPRSNVPQVNADPPNGILPVCYKTTKEKPKISPKPRSNVPRNMDQLNDASTEDVVTAKETDQSKDENHSTADIATPKEGKEIDEPENHSTGDVATPKENAESPAEPDSKSLQLTEQPTEGKHGDNAVMPRGKPIISPKPTLNATNERDKPNDSLPGYVVTQQVTPKVLATPDAPKIRLTHDTPKVLPTKEKPKIRLTPNTPKVLATQETPMVLSNQDTPKVLSTKDTPKVMSKQDTLKVLSKQSLNDLEGEDSLPGDASAPKEDTKSPPEPGLNVPTERDQSVTADTSKKIAETSLKPALNAPQVTDRTRFVLPGNTGTYKGKRIFSSPSSVYDEQIFRSQMRRQNKQIENSRRAKRLEEERLAHKKREEEYREMIEEENITKKMQEWLSRRSKAIQLEEESFHKKIGKGDLRTTMRKFDSKRLNLQEHGEMEMVEEVLKQKLIQKENRRKDSLEGERLVKTKQDENTTSVMQDEDSRKKRELGDNGQRVQTDVRSSYRKKREDRIRKMKESGENDLKWIESQKRDEEFRKENSRNEVKFQVNREKGEKQTLQELNDTRESGSLTNIEQTTGSQQERRIKLKKMEELSRKIKELQERGLMEDRCDESEVMITDSIDGDNSVWEEEYRKEESDKEGKMTLHTTEMKSSPNNRTETTTSLNKGTETATSSSSRTETPTSSASSSRTETPTSSAFYFPFNGVLLSAAVVIAAASVAVYYELL